jgi:hypothetical protein
MGLRTGPQRKTGVSRYESNGRIINKDRGEKPEAIVATAKAQRVKFFGAKEDTWHIPLMGYAFGRLFLQNRIDARQMSAARVFTVRAVRYFKTVGVGLPKFPSVAAEFVASGGGASPDPDEDTVAAVRSAYAEIQDALADAGMHFDGNKVLMSVCISDREPQNDVEFGVFRSALNVISHRLRL